MKKLTNQDEREAKTAKFDNEWAVKKAKWERSAVMEKFCEGLSNEGLEQLPTARDLVDFWQLKGEEMK